MQNINLTPILQALIGLLAALITYRLIPMIRSRTTESQQAVMESVLYGLVSAAENLYKTGRITDKLEWVKAQLLAQGFDVDVATIEGVVADLFPHEERKPPDEAEDDLK